MIKYKKQYLTSLFMSSILLIFFVVSCTVVDPGWKYKISDPYHKDINHYEYVYRSYPLDIKLAADDFALEIYVHLQITTPLDSIIIYPTSSYIKSPHFVDTTHFPVQTTIESFQKDSLSASKHKIKEDGFSGPYFLHKEDKLLVRLKFRGFAIHDKRNRNAPFTSEKSDFILHYDIHNNNNPLTFSFKPVVDSTKNSK